MNEELMSCAGDLIDPQYKIEYSRSDITEVKPITHFSEYELKSQNLPQNLIDGFNKHMRKPTQEEYEQYAIEQAKEKERIRKQIEYEEQHPPFLSDEWRWMMIDRRGGY